MAWFTANWFWVLDSSLLSRCTCSVTAGTVVTADMVEVIVNEAGTKMKKTKRRVPSRPVQAGISTERQDSIAPVSCGRELSRVT